MEKIMIQILFEGLICVMREYVSEKKKYFVAAYLKKVAYKCGIALGDYEVHDEIGMNTLIRKSAGLN